MTCKLDLPTNEVHLWCVDYADVVDAHLPARYHALLDDDETARRLRFRFERDQRSYAVSHALLRTTLSRYCDVAPEAWRFAAGPHGRPEIAEPTEHGALRFNLSHTRGAALVGVVRRSDVGVDVETLDRRTDGDALAERYFSPREVCDLRLLADARRREAFFEYWTLKEAYVKARGLGLQLPLDRFSFVLAPPRVDIEFDPRLDDDPQTWQFASFRLGDHFPAAAAVRRGRGEPLRFVLRRTVPLGEVGPPEVLPI